MYLVREINCNNYTQASFGCPKKLNSGSQSRFKVLFIISLSGSRAKDQEKNRTEYFYSEMTLECFAVCNNSVLSFIILRRVLKIKKKNQTEYLYFEMTSECFAVCKNSVLSFFIILRRVLKIKKKFGPSKLYFEMTLECFAVCNNSVLSFMILRRVLKIKKKIGPSISTL